MLSAWGWALGQGLLKTYVINSFPLDRKYWRYVFKSKWNVRLPVVKKIVFFIMFHFSLICLLKYYKSTSKVDIFTSWNKSFHLKKWILWWFYKWPFLEQNAPTNRGKSQNIVFLVQFCFWLDFWITSTWFYDFHVVSWPNWCSNPFHPTTYILFRKVQINYNF